MINTKIGERTDNLIIEYCLLRYKHEIGLKELKSSLKLELSEVFYKTKNISRQKIDFIRAAYEKLINNRFSSDNTNDVRNTREIAEFIYTNLIDNINKRENSNNKDYYADNYAKAKEEIINYYKTYFDNTIKIKDFRETHFNELRLLSVPLKDDNPPIYIAANIYKRLKSDLHILKHDPSEITYCRDEYEFLKDTLLNKIQEINKEFN